VIFVPKQKEYLVNFQFFFFFFLSENIPHYSRHNDSGAPIAVAQTSAKIALLKNPPPIQIKLHA
jgi:hypothetical protein